MTCGHVWSKVELYPQQLIMIMKQLKLEHYIDDEPCVDAAVVVFAAGTRGTQCDRRLKGFLKVFLPSLLASTATTVSFITKPTLRHVPS